MDSIILSQDELAKRWKISPRTLERWRWQNEGVKYIKIGRHVRYRLDDVEKYENERENDANRS